MAEGIYMEKDEITPWLKQVGKLLDSKEPLAEVGERMVTMVKEAHNAGREFETGRPYARLSARYKKRKAAVGGSPKILVGPSPGHRGGGSLLASWRVLKVSKSGVTVGGGARNRKLASAHDGGLARHLGRDPLNRLRLSWPDKKLKTVLKQLMERYFAP